MASTNSSSFSFSCSDNGRGFLLRRVKSISRPDMVAPKDARDVEVVCMYCAPETVSRQIQSFMDVWIGGGAVPNLRWGEPHRSTPQIYKTRFGYVGEEERRRRRVARRLGGVGSRRRQKEVKHVVVVGVGFQGCKQQNTDGRCLCSAPALQG